VSLTAPTVLLSASVDTEEDNWVATRDGVTTANIARLPRMHERMSRLGLRLTYFSAYRVAIDPAAAAVLRELNQDGAEIGGHLHPWNTPPLQDAWSGRNTMLKNLDGGLQEQKIACLTDAIRDGVGSAPTAFRAGRFALGPETVAALIRNGYRVDSSVMPWVDWRDTDDGPNYVGAPMDVYRLSPSTPINRHTTDGGLVEVPLCAGFNRWPFQRWAAVFDALGKGLPARARLRGLAARTGFLRRIMMSPEGSSAAEMIRLARLLVSHGARHLQIIWHSPTIVAGLTPFARTEADVELLHRRVEEFVEGVARFATLQFATVGETALRLAPPATSDKPRARAG